MFNLMKYKNVFFVISLLVILPGIFSLTRWGLKPSIDFTGGTLLEIRNANLKGQTEVNEVKQIFSQDGTEVGSVQKTSAGTYLFRTKPIDTAKKDKLVADVTSKFGVTEEERFETVGPVIGAELARNAILSVALASLGIVLFVAYAFREVPAPYKSWKFGVSAVIALLHDVFVVVGIFSLFGHFFGAEIDALFVTALLTVIGFSVHDTIVVFDRIRENLRKTAGRVNFEQVTNESILQTLGRSLSTSLTVLFTLLALILFGGESIRWFVIALFVGVFSGTYSSIFNAAPILVLWEEYKKK